METQTVKGPFTGSSFYYFDNGYTCDRSEFKSADEIVEDVIAHIEDAWNEFAKSHELLPMKFNIDITRSSSSSIIPKAESKIFRVKHKILSKVFDRFKQTLNIGSGIEIRKSGDDFLVTPYILGSVTLSWVNFDDEAFEDAILLDGDYEGFVYYDIRDRKWYTKVEYHKTHPDILI